jgi:hypothetical protein
MTDPEQAAREDTAELTDADDHHGAHVAPPLEHQAAAVR